MLAGRLAEAHTLAERTLAPPDAPGTRQRGVCPAPARRHYGTV